MKIGTEGRPAWEYEPEEESTETDIEGGEPLRMRRDYGISTGRERVSLLIDRLLDEEYGHSLSGKESNQKRRNGIE